MLPKLLELHFSQLQSEWSSSKYNTYSDKKKEEYHKNLSKIIQHLEKEDFSGFDEAQVKQRFYIIYFVFKSLEFLNHSTTSTIPFELVYVLEKALKDWSPADEYLIVTSLINGINEFSFDNSLTFFDLVYTEIKLLCGVTFSNRLVQINLPESTSRDYLANVVLYHELGHFVEKKYAISRVLYIELIKAMKSGLADEDKADILRYFPYMSTQEYVEYLEKNYSPQNMFAMHIGEFFCDLFASQYIQGCSNYYLEYITLNQQNYSNTHPSTVARVIFINEYLAGKNGFVLAAFKRITKSITSIDIGYKAKEFSTNNFESLIPVTINDEKELHGLFVYGWKVWLEEWENIRQKAGIEFKLTNSNVYSIVNNLIEKSIGNFIVSNEWNQTKS